MGFFPSLSTDHLQRYFRIIQEGVAVRRHFDLLKWLQGEVQHYLPHEILLAAWGDFSSNNVRYDIISPLPGLRTAQLQLERFSPLLRVSHDRWIEMGRVPYASRVCEAQLSASEILQGDGTAHCSFGRALRNMRSSLFHGISDERGQHDCLYVVFSSKDELDDSTLIAMEILLPYLDTALRRVTPLPQRSCRPSLLADVPEYDVPGLSEREAEIMTWVRKGKTNAEIGSILCISSYTVKNHLHQIFRKLDVYNRVQAISKIEQRAGHG
ncbi:MAG TPA: XrtB/PEP-CTERM-associated transcriptional regulator EpsA [Nitrosospira sp.]|jgi:transcriptional regulator EpsA|nr:XrtB/PEP-CTERM-associated transcriptional regulator EpsA [Nitrosospira sp.]